MLVRSTSKRHRIPELGGMIRACRQNPSAVWTKRRVLDAVLMVKGGDELARGRIPELGGFVRACRQNPSTVRTKRHVRDAILMFKGGDGACPRSHPRAWRFRLYLP